MCNLIALCLQVILEKNDTQNNYYYFVNSHFMDNKKQFRNDVISIFYPWCESYIILLIV